MTQNFKKAKRSDESKCKCRWSEEKGCSVMSDLINVGDGKLHKI